MVNSEALFLPRHCLPRQVKIMRNKICAIQLIPSCENRARLGALTQIPQNAELEICGDGFDERTVKVRWQDSFYFVFRDDIEVAGIEN